jgi:glucoamylase
LSVLVVPRGDAAIREVVMIQGSMVRRTAARVAALGLVAGGAAVGAPAAAGAQQAVRPSAPGYPGAAATWSRGDKDGFGTAIGALNSKVWYTLNDGTLSEVYFPRIDTEGSRDTQFVVTDGSTFSDREDTATTHQVRLVDRRALVFEQVNTARSGRYRFTKRYVTDPSRSAVLVDVRFESLTGQPYQVYLLHDVGLGLNANDDTGRSEAVALLADDGVQASAVLSSTGFTRTSSGWTGSTTRPAGATSSSSGRRG